MPLPSLPPSFAYYPGQIDYLSRVATRDSALIAADTGTGKTLFAISLIRLKLQAQDPSDPSRHTFNGRALILAPQGTVHQSAGADTDTDSEPDTEDTDTDSSLTSPHSPPLSIPQWQAELRRFAPGIPVHTLLTWADAQALIARYGTLPNGIYISYYEAFLRNKSREHLPPSWDHARLCSHLGVPIGPTHQVHHYAHKTNSRQTLSLHHQALLQHCREHGIIPDDDLSPTSPPPPVLGCFTYTHTTTEPVHDYTASIGLEKNGIRCILEPSLATLIQSDHPFDLIALDEAHLATHLHTHITTDLLRLQARFRYALTATPIPNIVTDLFPIMGWLCVPDWHKGGLRNPAWPYAREDAQHFADTFLSVERDYTQEEINRCANTRWRGKCVKTSPVISSPARLLKLLTPTLAYISKQTCNPDLPPITITDVRVPLGQRQAALYTHFLDRSHIPARNPLIRARKQLAYLRNICADPAGFTHGGPSVHSNHNPKTLAVLQLTLAALQRGETVTIVTARIGQTNFLQHRLIEALGPDAIARIDSTVPASQHALQAHRFKTGQARVILMGIKCAKAYSFPHCPNLIIASLEYTYGSLHQALGRVWRVNSSAPVHAWCVLHTGTIEDTMFDIVATKQDAATICLLGQRVPRDFKPIDLEELLTLSAANTHQHATASTQDEAAIAQQWPALRDQLHQAYQANCTPPSLPSPSPSRMPIPSIPSIFTRLRARLLA